MPFLLIYRITINTTRFRTEKNKFFFWRNMQTLTFFREVHLKNHQQKNCRPEALTLYTNKVKEAIDNIRRKYYSLEPLRSLHGSAPLVCRLGWNITVMACHMH